MTYTERLQKEAEELARLDYPHARPEVIRDIAKWDKYQKQASHLLAKQAEAYREGINYRNGYHVSSLETTQFFIDNGLVPQQTNQDEEITK